MGAFSWLRPGNDRELAATRYAGRESASDRKARLETERATKPAKNAGQADRTGNRWQSGGYCADGFAHTGRCRH